MDFMVWGLTKIISDGSTPWGNTWFRGLLPRVICQYRKWTGESSAASMTF